MSTELPKISAVTIQMNTLETSYSNEDGTFPYVYNFIKPDEAELRTLAPELFTPETPYMSSRYEDISVLYALVAELRDRVAALEAELNK